MYLWQPGKSSPASNPFLLWARHRLPHKRPSRKVPHALRPRAAHVGPHRRWRSRVLGLPCVYNTRQRSAGTKINWTEDAPSSSVFRPEHALNQRSFFGTQNSFSPRSLPSLPSVGPRFALSYNTSYCIGPRSPIWSRWRLPVGLGSLNKISVPVANQCCRLLHLLSATRISERREEKRLERREGCVQWGLRQM